MELEKRYPNFGGLLAKRSLEKDYSGIAKTQDQLAAEAFSKPATADCIMAHLMRMSAHLQLKGASKDDDGLQSAFLLSDYTERLLEHKVLEVDLFLTCEHFIENSDEGFFPTIAKILKHLGKKVG